MEVRRVGCERKYPVVPSVRHFRQGKDEIEVGLLSLLCPLPDEASFHAGQNIIGKAIL